MRGEVVHPESFARVSRENIYDLEAEVSRLKRLLDTKQAALESLVITNKNIRRQLNSLNIELKHTSDDNERLHQYVNISNENIEVLKEQRLRMETYGQQQRYHNMQLKIKVERLLINSRLKTNKLKRTNNENIKLFRENSMLKKALIKLHAEIKEAENPSSLYCLFKKSIRIHSNALVQLFK